ncbi:LANO_0H15632g1_1 [Lachancea nothofagi CBS 11611]|uniref:Folylpolyglutamate synthase n=1 Tax=Lachancea nothofagi CBS 11611 TaxID=1266666 RepID=A0A1G4KML0_9SACH|nr:LANO_0H15632g1_1 [Lachancea nothofagi CBS 11611]
MRLNWPLRMSANVSRTYNDAISALNSLQSNYANIMAIRASGDRKNQMNIWEMQEWSRRIGYETCEFDKLNIVHITGTKGKGSTAAFTQSLLQQYSDKISRIGLYTSPHLKSVRERIQINGKPICEEKFSRYFFDVWDKLDNTTSSLDKFPHMTPGSKPGYFKYLTLLSFHVFVQEGCDSCIYEVGVGGEYDSTNIIEKPTACGVSLLGIDHTFMLGDTIEEIAWNKGGIFKKSAAAFTIASQPTGGLKILHERALERKTTLTEVPIFNELKHLKLGLAGDFQITNASLAVALASQHLYKLGILSHPPKLDADMTFSPEFKRGLTTAEWKGRCQTVLDNNATWLIDGAHTKDSIQAASTWFKSQMTKTQNKKILLFNQQTRNADALITDLHSCLSPEVQFDHVIFTTNVTWKSGDYSADLVSMNTSKEQVDNLEVQNALRETWLQLEPDARVDVVANIESACDLIKEYDEAVEIAVTGSLHLVGGLLVVFDGKQ